MFLALHIVQRALFFACQFGHGLFQFFGGFVQRSLALEGLVDGDDGIAYAGDDTRRIVLGLLLFLRRIGIADFVNAHIEGFSFRQVLGCGATRQEDEQRAYIYR